MNGKRSCRAQLVAASRPIWTALLTRLLREIVAQERFQPLNSPDDDGTITQKTRLGARGERGDAGLAKKKMKFPPWTATDIGQLKSQGEVFPIVAIGDIGQLKSLAAKSRR
jgi:hypothetical protein